MAGHNARQPEPVLTRAGVIAALGVLSALLVKTGAGDVSTWLSIHSDEVAGGILTAGTVVAGFLARRHVTPLASPKGADGSRLTPDLSVVVPDDALIAAETIHPMGA